MNPQEPNDPNNPQQGQGPSPIPPNPQPPYSEPQASYTPPQPQPPVGYPPPAQAPNWQPQAPGQPAAFGGPGYYTEQVNGSTILTIGIVAFFCFGIILGPVAWVMGNNALAAIDAGRADPSQRANAAAGRICGIIATALSALGILIYIILIVFGLAAGLTHPST